MLEPMQKAREDFQKMGKDNYDAMVRSYGELNKGFQAIASRWTDFSKRSFEDSTRAWEQMIGAKSIEQAFEIQTNYVKKAYDNWMAEMSKIGEMYSSAARDAYKPVEQAMAKKAA
jgi:phasin family protein